MTSAAEFQSWVIFAVGMLIGLIGVRIIRGRWGFLSLFALVCCASSVSAQTEMIQPYVGFLLRGGGTIMNPNGSQYSYDMYWTLGQNNRTNATGTSAAALDVVSCAFYVPILKYEGSNYCYWFGTYDLYQDGTFANSMRTVGVKVERDDANGRLRVWWRLNAGSWSELIRGDTNPTGSVVLPFYPWHTDGTLDLGFAATAGPEGGITIYTGEFYSTTQATTQSSASATTAPVVEGDFPWLGQAKDFLTYDHDGDAIMPRIASDFHIEGGFGEAFDWFKARFTTTTASENPGADVNSAVVLLHANATMGQSGAGVVGNAWSLWNTMVTNPSTGIIAKMVAGIDTVTAQYPLLFTFIKSCVSLLLLWSCLLKSLEIICWSFGFDAERVLAWLHVDGGGDGGPLLVEVDVDPDEVAMGVDDAELEEEL